MMVYGACTNANCLEKDSDPWQRANAAENGSAQARAKNAIFDLQSRRNML
jgi:hypothetical protein